MEQNIIQLLGIASLPEEEKAKLIERMARLVERRLILRLAKDLSDADMKAVEALSEKGDSDAAAAFLAERFPKLEEMVREEIQAVKREAVEVVQEIDKP